MSPIIIISNLHEEIKLKCISSIDNSSISIKDIHHDKYTRIFRIFHKFKYQNNESLNTFSMKPHLIFYMYNDAKLLEVKSLQDNKRFECSIQGKIKLNLESILLVKII